jgi:hypothetical protein
LFQYVLSDSPSSDVEVHVEFFDANGASSTTVSAYPASLTFYNGASGNNLVGSFYLDADPRVKDNFIISLTFTGTNKNDYEVENIVVRVVSSFEPLPAPNILQVIMSNSGAYFSILYDTNTDMAGYKGAFSCSDLYIFTSADIMLCNWVSSNTVKATFPSYSSDISFVSPGDVILSIGELIRSACTTSDETVCMENFVNTNETAIIEEPNDPVVPSALLSMPSFISSCDDLIIDASSSSGSSGRDWSLIHWRVTSSSLASNSTEIAVYLNSLTSLQTPITITSLMMQEDVTYTFTLTLGNFLGKSDYATKSVAVSGNPNIPFIKIAGGAEYVSISSYDILSIQSSAVFSACATSRELEYKWEIFDEDSNLLPIVSYSVDPRQFKLESYSLSVLRSYLVRVTATVLPDATVRAAMKAAQAQGQALAFVSGSASSEVTVNVE